VKRTKSRSELIVLDFIFENTYAIETKDDGVAAIVHDSFIKLNSKDNNCLKKKKQNKTVTNCFLILSMRIWREKKTNKYKNKFGNRPTSWCRVRNSVRLSFCVSILAIRADGRHGVFRGRMFSRRGLSSSGPSGSTPDRSKPVWDFRVNATDRAKIPSSQFDSVWTSNVTWRGRRRVRPYHYH